MRDLTPAGRSTTTVEPSGDARAIRPSADDSEAVAQATSEGLDQRILTRVGCVIRTRYLIS
jgi:hypothetical protein